MSIQSLIIVNIIIALLIVGFVYVIVSVAINPHPVWKNGYFVCILGMLLGIILVFKREYVPYGITSASVGVLGMVAAVAYTRYSDAKGLQFEGHNRSTFIIRSVLFVVVAVIVAAPFLTMVTNQNEIKGSQTGIFSLLSEVLKETKRNNELRERDYKFAIQKSKKDSLWAIKTEAQRTEIKELVKKGLGNDRAVKEALRKTSKTSLIFVPQSKTPNLTKEWSMPEVKTVTPTLKGKKRKTAQLEADSVVAPFLFNRTPFTVVY